VRQRSANAGWLVGGDICVVALVGYLFAAVLTRFWMVYNALMDLHNRVQYAWAEFRRNESNRIPSQTIRTK